MGSILSNLMSLIMSRKLDVVIVGECNSGKTTLLNILSEGVPLETVPTVGLDVRIVKRGKLQMKCWDLGGKPQYQHEWARYTRGCDCILFVVDCYDTMKLPEARASLHRLLEDKDLITTPLLIIANKIDLEPHVSETNLIKELNLDYITENAWVIIPTSALRMINIEKVLQWLEKHSEGGGRRLS